MIRRHARTRPQLQSRSRARARDRIRAALSENELPEGEELRVSADAPLGWGSAPPSAPSGR
ncbi:MAG: hypothetical protein RL071_1795 [Pseudomonadota bacterium]|jgi:hypothetical protein